MGLLDGLAAPVATVINLFGTPAEIRYAKAGTHDTELGTSKATPTKQNIKIVITEYETQEVRGTILSSDRKGLVAAADTTEEPRPDDKICLADGTVYRIIGPVSTTTGTDDALMYELQLRK